MILEYPDYINRSADYNSPVPYRFENARFYNFVLQADPNKIQRLCDDYFNKPSRFLVNYQPLAPLAIIQFARYPKCYSVPYYDQGYGYMVYEEVLVTVVLEKGETCVFNLEMASFVPFLFLDNAKGISAGREVFSMPKMHGTINIPEPGMGKAVFGCSAVTLPHLGKFAQAREMELIRIVAPKGFVALGDNAETATWDEIDDHVYRSFDSDSGITSSQSKSVTSSMRLPFVNLRQFRKFPQSGEAIQKSIFKFQASDFRITKGGPMIGVFFASFPEQSPLFPLVDVLGLTGRLYSAFWFEWNFQFKMGKDIWRSDGMI